MASDRGFFLAANSKDAPDDTKHIGKKRGVAKIQILATLLFLPLIVASDGGKCPLIFFDEDERLTSAFYVGILANTVFKWAYENYGDAWIWQQDGARPHTDNVTQGFLRENAPALFDKDSWPPYSPALSPLDFAIFGHLKGMLSGVNYTSKAQLKTAINDA